jgi:hypothetical protein
MTVAAEKQRALLAEAGVPPDELDAAHRRFLAEAVASPEPPVWVAQNRAARGTLTHGDPAPDAPLGDTTVLALAAAAGRPALLLAAGSYS